VTSPSARELLLCGTPFLDVRAPGAALKGTLPGAVNLPVLDDAERRRVGQTYKQSGHAAAEALGYQLVSGALREARVSAWLDFARQHPAAWIFCWRGGQRSEIAQRWLAEAGIHLPRIPGGFKALRRVCLEILAEAPSQMRWFVLGGRTGSGKTRLLNTLCNSLDLEALAQHRGSAFGAQEVAQPAPVTFENTLATAVLARLSAGTVEARALVLEDEGRTIGRLALPESWHARMQRSPLVILEVPLQERCANIVREYVAEPLARGVSRHELHKRYSEALSRIERRLGSERRGRVQKALDAGFSNDDHQAWIEMLLTWYYDPMYDYQLSRAQPRVIFRGDYPALLDYCRGYEAAPGGRSVGSAGR